MTVEILLALIGTILTLLGTLLSVIQTWLALQQYKDQKRTQNSNPISFARSQPSPVSLPSNLNKQRRQKLKVSRKLFSWLISAIFLSLLTVYILASTLPTLIPFFLPSYHLGITRGCWIGANVSCPNTNLSDVYLPRQDLSGSDFSNVNFDGAVLALTNFEDSVLENANLSGTSLYQANFRNATLENAKINFATLTEANLTDANLRGADFNGSLLRDTIMQGADLYEANFNNADLSGADLQDVKGLDNAKLSGANLDGIIISPSVREALCKVVDGTFRSKFETRKSLRCD